MKSFHMVWGSPLETLDEQKNIIYEQFRGECETSKKREEEEEKSNSNFVIK